jgi:plasmid stabilization system protein ParE
VPRRSHAVAWTDPAVRDLEAIARFIASDSPLNAGRVLARLRERARELSSLPERGRVVPELARFGIVVYREVIVRPYRIVYRVRDRSVHVLAVLDGRREIEDLLFERMACPPPSPPPYGAPKRRRRGIP